MYLFELKATILNKKSFARYDPDRQTTKDVKQKQVKIMSVTK